MRFWSRYSTAVFFSLLLFSIPVSAQEPVSEHVTSFLEFVHQNHFSNISQAEYHGISPAEWAWIVGKAFETVFEVDYTNSNPQTQRFRMQYLSLLWEELVDYLEWWGNQNYDSGYTASDLKEALILGFYGYDNMGGMARYYHDLKMSSPFPAHQLYYYDYLPNGGRVTFDSYYFQPWTMSMEEYYGSQIRGGTYLERPAAVYTDELYAGSSSRLDSDIVSGRSTGGSDHTRPGPDQRSNPGEPDNRRTADVPEEDLHLINGTWRGQIGRGTVEFTFTFSGKSGTFTRRLLVDGNERSSLSGQLEGYRKDKGEYYEFKVYSSEPEGRMTIRSVDSGLLSMTFLKDNWINLKRQN